MLKKTLLALLASTACASAAYVTSQVSPLAGTGASGDMGVLDFVVRDRGTGNVTTQTCAQVFGGLAGFTCPSLSPSGTLVAGVTVTRPYANTIASVAVPNPRYAGLGAGGGANVATAVTALPNSLHLSAYSDTGADQVSLNTMMGFTPSASALPVSLHMGKNNEGDFTDINYDYGVIGYAGAKIISLPLTWVGGTSLANAATGSLDADYLNNAKRLIKDASADGQDVLYLRIGWEFNQNNQASSAWYSGGNQANYATAFQRYVTQIRTWQAAFAASSDGTYGLAAVKAAGGVGTVPTVKIIWCANLTGDDPAPSYPGDSYVDLVGTDIYDQTSGSGDPTAWFSSTVLNGQYGLTYWANFAAAHSKRLAFPEFGVSRNDGGIIYKLMHDWIVSNGAVDIFTTWNSDGGGYASNLVTGERPNLAAWVQHEFNPVSFPVEPVDAPTAIGVTPGNGTLTVQVAPPPAWMSIQPTQILVYEGTTPGGETMTAGSEVATISASASPAVATLTRANGTPYYYKAVYKLANGNVGFASAEATGTAIAPASNTPAHYVSMGVSGFASTPFNSNQVAGASTVDYKTTYCLPSLAPVNGSGNAILGGLWGNTGYSQSLVLAFNAGNIFEAVHDNSGNTNVGYYNGYASKVVAGGCYTDEIFYTPSTGLWTNYHSPAGYTGAPTLLGTTQATAGIIQGTPSQDPQSLVTPTFRLAQDSNGGSQANVEISEAVLTIGGTLGANGVTGGTVVLHPLANGSGFGDVTGAVWTVGGGATEY